MSMWVLTSDEKAASANRRARNRKRGESRGHPRVRARPIYAGTRFKITRRCLERRFFLSCGKEAKEIKNHYGYTLGISLERYGVLMHASCQVENHHHTDGTDVHGNRPGFKCSFHGNLARGLNAKRGRFDSFWDGDGSCDTVAPTDEETLRDLVYTDTNPVAAGLVKRGDQWPGFTTYGWRFGETRTFTRPSWYYDPNNPDNPEEIEITRVRPDIFPELSDDELFELLMKQCREREREIREQMRQENRRFKGVNKLRKQKWDSKPANDEKRFTVRPKVASSDRWRRLAQLQRDRDWERAYAIAREKLKAGESPVFPHGTYQLRLRCGVRVAQAPP